MPSEKEIEAAAISLCKELDDISPKAMFDRDMEFTWLDFYKPVARFALEAAEKARAKVTTLEDTGLTEDEFKQLSHEYIEDLKFTQRNS